ncbi:fucose 4-O-acetylase-like acetyltransferase [Scopulibacillus darangshiensis]|uniref:Fucose 4-O-acetylase-like acetyltransferase n=1 Tax=Scopulibacillus darangshiensis TaxID=442528 RepID=A0A4V6NQN4_9BACL|nr:acyltransferase family protein [Scopulibacillus darangshiensis]TCP28966.1 fucose 4-O-acetylase-like acetyltransferase [Scopulibacillus darangshiensis]
MIAASKRDAYFDNAKLILIFLVVFGHVISPLKNDNHVLFTLYTSIFLFHMPGFILISGFFAKNFRKKGYILKLAKKLLLPYLLFQAIYSVFYYWNGDEPTLTFNPIYAHWTLWFLVSMFCWHLMLFVFDRFRWIGLAVAVILGMGIGYIDFNGGFLSLSRTFVFFPFFLLGYLLKPAHFEAFKKIPSRLPLGLLILAGIFITFWIGFPQDATDWLLGSHTYADMGTPEVTDGLIRAGQYILTAIVLAGFLATVPAKSFALTVIGQRTLIIYLLHGFIIKTIETLIPDDSLEPLADNYLVLFIFSWAVCLILGSYVIKKWTRPIIEFRIN